MCMCLSLSSPAFEKDQGMWGAPFKLSQVVYEDPVIHNLEEGLV